MTTKQQPPLRGLTVLWGVTVTLVSHCQMRRMSWRSSWQRVLGRRVRVDRCGPRMRAIWEDTKAHEHEHQATARAPNGRASAAARGDECRWKRSSVGAKHAEHERSPLGYRGGQA